MCHFALVGAQTDFASLRGVLCGPDSELDTDLQPPSGALKYFPATDSVVCLTTDGCSCELVRGLGCGVEATSEAHLAGRGYMFRRALAAAGLRFGSIRFLAYDGSLATDEEQPPKRRSTKLSQFLRFGLEPDDRLVCIIA